MRVPPGTIRHLVQPMMWAMIRREPPHNARTNGTPAQFATVSALVPVLAVLGLAMANDGGPVTVRTVHDLGNPDTTRSRWAWPVTAIRVERSTATPVRLLHLVHDHAKRQPQGLDSQRIAPEGVGRGPTGQVVWRERLRGLRHSSYREAV